MTNHWRTRESDMFLASIVLGLLAGGMAFWLFRFRVVLGLVVFFVVFFLVYDRTRAHHKTMVKMFYATLADAQQVVQNVLDEKGLPYKMIGDGHFFIGDEVEIKVSKFRTNGGLEGTAVSLTPKNPESQQIIFSLRQKLDDAFRPRGL